MFKKNIKYTDFNDVLCEEEAFFNLTVSELIDIESEFEGGFENAIKSAAEKEDSATMIAIFKKLIIRSYGIKSADGKRHSKITDTGASIGAEFAQTAAFDALFLEVISNDTAAAEFVNGIIPTNLAQKVSENAPVITMNK